MSFDFRIITIICHSPSHCAHKHACTVKKHTLTLTGIAQSKSVHTYIHTLLAKGCQRPQLLLCFAPKNTKVAIVSNYCNITPSITWCNTYVLT